LALVELILGLYILYLNPRHRANRWTALFILLFAAYTFALASLTGAQNTQQVRLPAAMLAATRLALPPALLATSLLIFRPNWLSRRGSNGGKTRSSTLATWALLLLLALVLLPLILTLADIWTGWGLWYTAGIAPQTAPGAATYTGSYPAQNAFTQGRLAGAILPLYGRVIGLAALFFLIYALIWPAPAEKGRIPGSPEPTGRSQYTRPVRLAAFGLLLAALFLSLTNLPVPVPVSFILALSASLVNWVSLLYAALAGIISPRYLQSGGLQPRLTALTLIIALPLLAGMSLFLTDIARRTLEENALNSLQASSAALSEATEIWLTDNVRALKSTAASPDMISMDAAQQEPVLKTLVTTYPYIYLASTTDMQGLNVARSDGRPPTDYSDRAWFRLASGADGGPAQPVSFQSLVGRTSGQPALVIAIPLRDTAGRVIGVAMSAFQLDQLARLVQLPQYRQAESVFIIDQENRLLVHSDPQRALLEDLSEYPPVKALRAGNTGALTFDEPSSASSAEVGATGGGRPGIGETTPTRAHVTLLSNGWAVVVQQPEATMFAAIRLFRRFTLAVIAAGALLLIGLSWPTIRQAIHPIYTLTAAAEAISQGDLTRTAPQESQDELGDLAIAFNQMTSQLRDLIGDLEGRVAERTRQLEERAVQLQVASDVAREAAALGAQAAAVEASGGGQSEASAIDRILNHVVELISERFAFYHAGIFLLTPQEERSGSGSRPGGERYAVLRAASSAGGQRMLARGHRLRVGKEGIVGFVAASGQPRIALDVGQDITYFNNPDLPQTRSEMALPLKIENRIIGVLDVQSRKPGAFVQEDVAILQVLADQVTLALENARLLAESRAALDELQAIYGRQVRQGWQKRLEKQTVVYRLSAGMEGGQASPAEASTPNRLNPDSSAMDHDPHLLELPIQLRGQQLGVLRLERDPQAEAWSQPEKALLQEATRQLALSLENARLLEEIRQRAEQEEQINRIVADIQGYLNLDAVMQRAAQEIGEAVGVQRLRLWLNPANEDQGERSMEGESGCA
jgi:GAF domain-containing protein/HAMP domain-containing protein